MQSNKLYVVCLSHFLLINLCDPCNITDPVVVPRHPGVDAILPLPGALLPPADDARQEPGPFVTGGKRPPAVPLARILLPVWITGTEHVPGDVVPAALFTQGPVHVGDRQLLKLAGLGALEKDPSPAAHQRARRLSEEALDEFFGAQADGTPLVGQLHGDGKLQQRNVVVVLRLHRVVQVVDVPLGHIVVSFWTFMNIHIMLP